MIVIDGAAGESHASERFFEKYRLDLVNFQIAHLFFNEADAVVEGLWRPGRRRDVHGYDVRELDAPTMSLVDSEGDQIWLEGANCGYGGSGPTTAVRILQFAGFHEDLMPYVTQHRFRVLKLLRHGPKPATAEASVFNTGESPSVRLLLVAGAPTLLSWPDRLGAHETDTWSAFLPQLAKWAPRPVGARFYLRPGYGPKYEDDGFHFSGFPGGNFCVQDQTGRVMWIALPSADDLPAEIASWATAHQLTKRERTRAPEARGTRGRTSWVITLKRSPRLS